MVSYLMKKRLFKIKSLELRGNIRCTMKPYGIRQQLSEEKLKQRQESSKDQKQRQENNKEQYNRKKKDSRAYTSSRSELIKLREKLRRLEIRVEVYKALWKIVKAEIDEENKSQ